MDYMRFFVEDKIKEIKEINLEKVNQDLKEKSLAQANVIINQIKKNV